MLERKRGKNQRGFSLIGVVILIVIVSFLVGVVALVYVRDRRSACKGEQSEAKQILRQIYAMERAYRQHKGEYWIPPAGLQANKDNPNVFADIGIEIMPHMRYTYSISGDANSFVATAICFDFDKDDTIDKWEINDQGQLQCVINDCQE